MPDWDEDSWELINNLKKALRQSRDQAFARAVPTADLARGWHAKSMAGLAVPDQKFVGRFRGESGLEGYGVRIGKYTGVRSTGVAAALQDFENTLQSTVLALDQLIPKGDSPSNADQLNAVIELCAWVHAEWVRIHPFANGNGRTARIWAGFLAMRYGLPPFVRLRPRPDGGYADACSLAMEGKWAAAIPVFRHMYQEAIT